MTTFKYYISQIKAYNNKQNENIVGEVVFEIIGSLNEKTHTSFFPVQLDAPDFNAFTPYQQLTQEQIISWVTEKIGQAQIDRMKNGIVAVLEYTPPEDAEPVLKEVVAPWEQARIAALETGA